MLGLITKSKNAAYFAKKYLKRTLSDESGATAIEYGLIAAGIAVAIIAAVFAIGSELNNFFLAVQTKLGNAYT
jgi:pilus assembly protein Flp/PilA